MSTRNRTLEGVRFNSRTLGLVVLFAVVFAGSLALRPLLVSSGVESAVAGSTTQTQAATGVGWVIIEVLFAGLLLVGIVAWRRLPEWVQDSITPALKFGVAAAAGAYGIVSGQFTAVLAVGVVFIAGGLMAREIGIYWAINDVLAIAIAIYVAAGVGITLGPVILGVGCVGLTVYDYVFADRATWMHSMAAWTVRRGLPMLFIVPTRWRLDWDHFADVIGGDEDEDEPQDLMQWGIGMGDLLLPAAFAVSLIDAGGLLVHGAIAGTLVACTRVSWKMENGGGAGLPPLVSGALGGWAVAAGVGVVLL